MFEDLDPNLVRELLEYRFLVLPVSQLAAHYSWLSLVRAYGDTTRKSRNRNTGAPVQSSDNVGKEPIETTKHFGRGIHNEIEDVQGLFGSHVLVRCDVQDILRPMKQGILEEAKNVFGD